jgi:hypothetical protein
LPRQRSHQLIEPGSIAKYVGALRDITAAVYVLSKPQYQVKDGKVYDTDAYGRVQQQKFEIKNEKSRSKRVGAGRRASH